MWVGRGGGNSTLDQASPPAHPRRRPSVADRSRPAEAVVGLQHLLAVRGRATECVLPAARRLPAALDARPGASGRHKFTNAYRASDRVSQYLIRNVIYRPDLPRRPGRGRLPHPAVQAIQQDRNLGDAGEEHGPLTYAGLFVQAVRSVLGRAMSRGQKIYSAAYIMPSGGSLGHERKHRNHLTLIERMIEGELPARMAEAASMKEAFNLIRGYPTIGDFLAYQYVTDINYSTVTNFTEMEFVVPGPGAIDGIRKCFADTGGMIDADVIRVMAERQEAEFERLGLEFPNALGPAASVDRLPEPVLRSR